MSRQNIVSLIRLTVDEKKYDLRIHHHSDIHLSILADDADDSKGAHEHLELTLRSDPPPPTEIDPDFRADTGDILLVTSDNVGFYFPLETLVKRVGFFSDLEDLPHVESDSINGFTPETASEIRRELPSATSAGLRLVLFALRQTGTATRMLLEIKSRQSEFLRALPEAFKIADAYDIPHLTQLLITAFHDDPFWTFTIAALNSNESLAKQESSRTIKLKL
ncbi:hypothetical protein IAR55_004797 [Kwoniella newhampshirensis]|uniref:Uncharacterized protein n=1 Tax=Kwoniella newhampshirensis TaxID=1651941 RepID=A0AAW0YIH9_9TREE